MGEVFADQHAHPAETGIEGGDIPPRFDESGLLEEPVGWQKDLAMDVHELVAILAGSQVGDAVVDPLPVLLVEPEDHVRRTLPRRGSQGRHQRIASKGDFAGGALDEVARQHRLREDGDIRGACQRRSHGGDVCLQIALPGLQLAKHDTERTHVTH